MEKYLITVTLWGYQPVGKLRGIRNFFFNSRIEARILFKREGKVLVRNKKLLIPNALKFFSSFIIGFGYTHHVILSFVFLANSIEKEASRILTARQAFAGIKNKTIMILPICQ